MVVQSAFYVEIPLPSLFASSLLEAELFRHPFGNQTPVFRLVFVCNASKRFVLLGYGWGTLFAQFLRADMNKNANGTKNDTLNKVFSFGSGDWHTKN